ncbi:hypothetical protein BAUCODRAFT_64942 [Baudoinia panamericana UAMH 10762]|uniref:Uncharacterized protein n=1 Tax=Baudoinia panamericana (strain UAMH 10762) TaxID=717646 RepID=M2N573_BAUPA|nr:uncharacterized protein BAUCODRAFT_64942 [Baudoinia panamericana UAMH 10762]EMC99168.1 hypothetical protein BAUCODRAFT_64942 [Baudoinia panamericana UAMH 10762]
MDVDAHDSRSAAASAWRRAHHKDYPPFFIPSYLRHSRHVERLHRAHDEHIAELQEQARLNPPNPAPSLSTSSSNNNLHKLHASHVHHRPAAVQDVIERLPPLADEDQTHPLPSRWSESDKMGGLEILTDGTEVRFGGVTKTSDEAASIRSDHHMPRECGLYYYEVTILSRGKDGLIGIGFSSKRAGLNRLPGWEQESWAYHGDDGYSFACTASGKAYGPRFSSGDVIGCGVNFRTGSAFFTKNGVYLAGVAFNDIKQDGLYPSVGMKKPGEHLRINFGHTPFVFDINGMMEEERHSIIDSIRRADVSTLRPPDDESTLVHKLISQYLAHEGYVETAKAFAQDVHQKEQSLSSNPEPFQPPDSEDDIHAISRQKIRKSILDGDIDQALKYTSSFYPHVLEEERNRDIYFRLKCRKFIEMMRRYTELVTATTSPATVTKSIDSLGSNGHPDLHEHSALADTAANGDADGDEDEDGEPDTQMELDDQLHREASKSLEPPTDDVDMDASQELPPKTSYMKKDDLQAAALRYGRELMHEFGGDPRPSVKKQLEDIFAIVAYENPADSPIGALLDAKGRVGIAEEVNGAILVSLGKPSSAALEKLCAQTEAMLDDTAARGGGAAAFVNVGKDFLED